MEGEDLFLRWLRAARLSQPVHTLRAVRAGEQRAGAVGPRPGDRLHHAAHRRGTRPPRRGLTDGRRDREIPRPPRHRLPRDRLGRRLQELVHQPAAHTGPVALSAERAQGVLRAGAGGRFPVHSQRAGRLITVAPTSGTLPLRRMVVPRSLIYRQGGVKGCGAAKPVASCSRILAVYAATSGGLITGTRFAV